MGMWVFEHKGFTKNLDGPSGYFLDPAEFVIVNAQSREMAISYVEKHDILDTMSSEWNWNGPGLCRRYDNVGALVKRIIGVSSYLSVAEVRRAGTSLLVEFLHNSDIRRTYDIEGNNLKLMKEESYEDWRKKPELVTPIFISKPRPDLKDWGLF